MSHRDALIYLPECCAAVRTRLGDKRAHLASSIGEVYGVTRAEAERQIEGFETRNHHPRPVSFR
jgi:hypothetical protein